MLADSSSDVSSKKSVVRMPKSAWLCSDSIPAIISGCTLLAGLVKACVICGDRRGESASRTAVSSGLRCESIRMGLVCDLMQWHVAVGTRTGRSVWLLRNPTASCRFHPSSRTKFAIPFVQHCVGQAQCRTTTMPRRRSCSCLAPVDSTKTLLPVECGQKVDETKETVKRSAHSVVT